MTEPTGADALGWGALHPARQFDGRPHRRGALVLGGTQDALVPAKVLRAALAVRPDWAGHVLDDKRHALMMEDPSTYLQIFERWLSEARAA